MMGWLENSRRFFIIGCLAYNKNDRTFDESFHDRAFRPMTKMIAHFDEKVYIPIITKT